MRTDEDRAKQRACYRKNKEQRRAYYREYYRAHPEFQEKHRSRTRQRNSEQKLLVLSHYSGRSLRCAHCGIDDIDVLSLDHINGGGAQHRKLNSHSYRWAIKENFPDGFQVLCFNCNWKKRLAQNK